MKPSNKLRRQANRAARREDYKRWTAMFALAGGHKDWYVPFNHQWKRIYADRIKSLEAGDPFYSQPRKQYDYRANKTHWVDETTDFI